MKGFKKHLILFVFLIMGASGFSQKYVPLLDGFKEWTIISCNGPQCLIDYYWLANDTTLRNQPYRLLDGYHFGNTVALREDTASRKVYSQTLGIGAILSPEKLLYDFSLQVGDSIDIHNPQAPVAPNPGYFTVDSIKAVNYLGTNRKTFYLSSNTDTNHAVWIEGIGSLSLINVLSRYPDHNKLTATTCVHFNGDLIYRFTPTDAEDSCKSKYIEPAMNLEKVTQSDNSINIYPNPTNGVLNFESTNNIEKIEVYNTIGGLVYKNFYKNKNRVLVDLESLHNNMYLIKLYSQNEVSTHRIIKQD
ncbi:MAG: T9SS type A sorting domain-containing protein [Salibacteraceae bacterium]